MVKTMQDVAERECAEEELRASKERYRDLYDNAPDMMASVDASTGDIVDCNQTLARALGYTKAEIIGQPASVLYDPNWRKVGQMVLQCLVETEEVRDVELQLQCKDGHRIDVSVNISAVRDEEGKVLRSRAIYRDITERKQLQRQLQHAQRMESVGRLVGGVAHDFNNQLSVIIGFAEQVAGKLHPDNPIQEDLRQIITSGEKSAETTRQLLAFSRRQHLQPKVVDLNETLWTVEGLLGRLIGEDIELVFVRERGSWPVKVDPAQLEQVIVNLAVNARDAMPGGGKLTIASENVKLTEDGVRNRAPMVAGPYVRVTVADTGEGMDEETLAQIFEPFFTTKEVGEGTGLGLAMVYGFVQQSGGYVWAYSEPGQGATFDLYFPAVEGPAAREKPSPTPGDTPRGSATILVAEDEDAVRAFVCKTLQRHGYTVLDAAFAAQALEIAEGYEGPIDLLVTDMVMPKMSGPELVEKLCEKRPGIKILYMSGYPSPYRPGIRKQGTHVVGKPLSVIGLMRKVREVLDL